MPDELVSPSVGQPPLKGNHEFKFIRWDDGGVVAHLTLNRPRQNIMNIEMLREMARAVEGLSHREDVRLILLDAAPECEGFFSLGVGADGYTQQMVFPMMDAFHSVFRAMMDISKPVLAVVDGVASGAGAELAAFCDLVVATETAQFRQPEIKLGVFPPWGPWFIPA